MPFNDVFNFLDNVYKGVKSDVSKFINPVENEFKTVGSDIAKIYNPIRSDIIHGVVYPIEHYTKPISTDIYNIGKTISSDIHTVGSDIAKYVNPVNLYHEFSGAISDIAHVLSKPIVDLGSMFANQANPPSTVSNSSNNTPPYNPPFSLSDFLSKYGIWLGLGVALIIVIILIARKK